MTYRQAREHQSSYAAYRHYLLDGSGNRDGIIIDFINAHNAVARFPQHHNIAKKVKVSPDDMVEVEQASL